MFRVLRYVGFGIIVLLLLPIFPLVVGSYLAYKTYKKTSSKKRGVLYAFLIIFAGFWLSGITASAFPTREVEEKKSTSQAPIETISPQPTPTLTPAPIITPSPTPEPTTKPTPTSTPIPTIKPTPVPTYKPKPIYPTYQPAPKTYGSCQYSCSGPDKDCSHFVSSPQAQSFFNCCRFSGSYDPMRLDRDNDGIACEE